jgi:hypothetical protein
MVRTGQKTCMSNNWDEICEAKFMALHVIIEIFFLFQVWQPNRNLPSVCLEICYDLDLWCLGNRGGSNKNPICEKIYIHVVTNNTLNRLIHFGSWTRYKPNKNGKSVGLYIICIVLMGPNKPVLYYHSLSKPEEHISFQWGTKCHLYSFLLYHPRSKVHFSLCFCILGPYVVIQLMNPYVWYFSFELIRYSYQARIALERRKFLKNANIAVQRQTTWSNLAYEMTAEFRSLCAEEVMITPIVYALYPFFLLLLYSSGFCRLICSKS